MGQQNQVKDTAPIEPMRAWINETLITVMNMGVEVGKTMTMYSQALNKASIEYKELKDEYDKLSDLRIKNQKELQLEVSTLADENKVLKAEMLAQLITNGDK